VVTEYADENLAQIIPERSLTPDEVGEMLPPVMDALSYLHGHDIVYGHLKPSNIMVVENQLKLPLDSAKGGTGARTEAAPGIYDAPETANGAGSPASDVWSLGVTVVEALTQRPPLWERTTSRDPLVPASLPEPFGGIARLCLRIDPGDRATLPAIKTRLEGGDASPVPPSERDTGPIPAAKVTVVSVPVSAPVSPTRLEPRPPLRTSVEEPRRTSKRGLIGLGGAGLMVLAVIVFIVFIVARGHRSEAPVPPVAQAPAATAPAPPAAVPPSPAPQPPTSSGPPVGGEATERVMPDVSSPASRTIHGKVLVKVKVTVDANGVVSGASVRSASSRYFGAKALEAARKWKFRPPQANSQAVPSEWTLEFIFRPNGTSVNPVQVRP